MTALNFTIERTALGMTVVTCDEPPLRVVDYSVPEALARVGEALRAADPVSPANHNEPKDT